MISTTSTCKQWVLLAAAATACSVGNHQVDCHTPTRQFATIKSLKKDSSKQQRQRSPALLLVRGGGDEMEDASQVFIEEESQSQSQRLVLCNKPSPN
jgi:hypothetical protein